MADRPASPSPFAATPLVGRERERATLRAALDAALAGRGALVLIGGEAGIGKTALAEWTLAGAVERGALALVGRCYDLAETPPYGPWVEAFGRAPHGGDVPAPPDLAGSPGAASQATLFAQVRDYLAALAARQPLVLLLDDLHWADPASLDLLRFLGRALADLPLLLLATYRADELMGLTPLCGHRNTGADGLKEGVHDGEDPPALPAGVPRRGGRTGPDERQGDPAGRPGPRHLRAGAARLDEAIGHRRRARAAGRADDRRARGATAPAAGEPGAAAGAGDLP
jgi:hypothetical protein